MCRESVTMWEAKRRDGIEELANSRHSSWERCPGELRQGTHQNGSLASRNGLKFKGPQQKQEGQRLSVPGPRGSALDDSWIYSFGSLQSVQSKYHPLGKHSALDQTDPGALLCYYGTLGVALPKHSIQYTLKWFFLFFFFLVMHIFCIDFFQPFIYMYFLYIHTSPPLWNPSHLPPIPPFWAITEHWVEFPVPHSKFPIAIYVTVVVSVSMLLSPFVPPLLSLLYLQVCSLCLHLQCYPANRFLSTIFLDSICMC